MCATVTLAFSGTAYRLMPSPPRSLIPAVARQDSTFVRTRGAWRSLPTKGASLRVTFHGVRGSYPSPARRTQRYGGNTSSVLVEADAEPPLLLDLGTGISTIAGTGVAEDGFRGNALVTH